MISFMFFVTLLATGYSQTILKDLSNIIYNTPIVFQNCDNIKVSSCNITFNLYTKNNQHNGISLNIKNLNDINPNNRIIFIIHGWIQKGSQPWILQMKDTYLNNSDVNIISVDWSHHAIDNYGASFCAVPQVGVVVGSLIVDLAQNAGVSLNSVQINGFSLGGHVAGYAGQEVQKRMNGSKIGRINGLDLAGPGYLNIPNNKRLDKSDAVFVQGIHTNNKMFGYTYPFGTVDFHVNSVEPIDIPFTPATPCGMLQPCCPNLPGITIDGSLDDILPMIFCNHVRAVVYFTASIISSDFLGVSCNCTRFGLGLCKTQPTTIMGENCPSNVSGEFFLNPNGIPPYPKGVHGTGGVGGIGGLECWRP